MEAADADADPESDARRDAPDPATTLARAATPHLLRESAPLGPLRDGRAPRRDRRARRAVSLRAPTIT